MKITKTFELNPVLRDSVWYVEWAAVSANLPGTDDYKIRARWNRYAQAHCAGKDALGKYYESKKHASATIRGFKKHEQTRKSE
jgi:hypothetical protein